MSQIRTTDIDPESATTGQVIVFNGTDFVIDDAPTPTISYNDLTDLPTLFDGAFSSLSGKPTTLSGYGITDAQALDADLTAIAALTGTSGLLHTDGSGTWSVDTSTYLTGINSSDITTALGFTPEDNANKGQANGYASLDGSGKVPSGQLPSYVDDVEEYADYASLPGTGETGKIYVTLDTNSIYRWSGSAYVEIVSSPGTTDDITEGSTNLYFTQARARESISVTQNLSYDSGTGIITGPDLAGYVLASSLETVATTGSYNDLLDKPTLFDGAFSSLTGKPTTLSGYGITDGQPLDADLTAIAALVGTSGLLRKTASDTWLLDTNTYVTSDSLATVATSGLIEDLDNVTITSPADGDILVYDATNSIWINSVPGSSGSLGLVDLVDVDVTSPANHEYLKYNGSGWVNATIAYSEVSGTPSLSTVATTGAYNDLTGTPSLSTVATTGAYNDLTGKPTLATVATSGLYSDLTGTPTLATVATSGSYTDLSNTPTIPTDLDSLMDVTITSPANLNYLKYNGSVWVNSAVTYSDISGTPSLATVATTGAYGDLAGTPDLTVYLPKSGGTMTGTLTLAGAPSGTNDAATKGYVDGVAAGLSFKETVQVTTTGSNISLDNTTTTLDGVTLTNGIRVLVKDQTDASENGIYVVSTSGAWSRSTDADQDSELAGGTSVFVSQGAQYGDCGFVIVSPDGPAIIGTDDILWTQFSSPGVVTIDVGDGLTVTTGPAYTIGTDVDSTTITNIGGTGAQLAVRGGSSGQVLKSNGVSTDASWLTIATVATTGAYGDLTGTPVIGTNIQAWDADLDAIAGLSGTSGILKKTAANTWTLDTNTYLTANQSISLTGDVTGTGTTSIATTLANSGVSAGTYKSVTVDVKGRVTSGTNPTTLAGYGITDAISTAQFTPYVTPITTVTATTYDLIISDVYIRASNASPQTVTIPPNATVAFPVGYQISVIQVGAGQVSISPGSGVTVNYPESLAIRKQFGAVTLTKVGTNEWDLIGDTTLA